jgi:ribosomal protein S14
MDSSLIDPRTTVKGILRPCCADMRNLQALNQFTPEHRYGMIKRQCRVCGRGHYELIADPGKFGMVGGRL